MQKFRNKNTNPVCWNKQGDEFKTNHISKVEIVLPELYAMESVAWNLHVD